MGGNGQRQCSKESCISRALDLPSASSLCRHSKFAPWKCRTCSGKEKFHFHAFCGAQGPEFECEGCRKLTYYPGKNSGLLSFGSGSRKTCSNFDSGPGVSPVARKGW